MHFLCIDRKRVGLSSDSGFNESEEKPLSLPGNMHGLDRLLRLAGCEARAYDGGKWALDILGSVSRSPTEI